jgi:hypothetical protein
MIIVIKKKASKYKSAVYKKSNGLGSSNMNADIYRYIWADIKQFNLFKIFQTISNDLL